MSFLIYLALISPFEAHSSISKFPKIEQKFKSTTGDSKKIGLGKKGVMIVFTSEHCPYDKDWRSRLVGAGHWARKKNIRVYFVNSNSIQTFEQNNLRRMKTSSEKVEMNFPYLRDYKNVLADTFKVSRTPAAFLYNSDGQLVYQGSVDENPEIKEQKGPGFLMKALKNLVAKKPISPSETDVIGCKLIKEPT